MLGLLKNIVQHVLDILATYLRLTIKHLTCYGNKLWPAHYCLYIYRYGNSISLL